MTPDAFSRALTGHRGFAAVELARLADLLGADLHTLITGEPDPSRLRIAARHRYDPVTRQRDVPGAEADRQVLADVELAYRQAKPAGLSPSELPRSLAAVRQGLGERFVRHFAERLDDIGVDIVRLPDLSTAYSFVVAERAVIVLRATGNWFWENWAMAHELGHLIYRHGDLSSEPEDTRDQQERKANAFAAELLLPAEAMRRLRWTELTPVELAERVWDLGVSTEALANRLASLQLPIDPVVAEWSGQPTQRLLRRHLRVPEGRDPITERMDAASARRFPLGLQEAHVRLIEIGAVRKDTLAWMLEVGPDDLGVDEPDAPAPLPEDELVEALGLGAEAGV